jgi:hypothetical protein
MVTSKRAVDVSGNRWKGGFRCRCFEFFYSTVSTRVVCKPTNQITEQLFMQRVVVFTSGKFTRARAASFLEKSSMSRIWSSQVIG